MLNLSGKITCFINKNESKKGEVFLNLSTGISHFDKDSNEYITKYLRVVLNDFDLEEFAKHEGTEGGFDFELLEAWLDVRYWTNSANEIQKELYIYAKRHSFEGKHKQEKKEEPKKKYSYSKK